MQAALKTITSWPFVRLMRETFQEWSEDGASSIAASLAYYAIFSLSPLLIVIALFLGLILDQATVQTSVLDGVRSTVGESGAELVQGLLGDSQASRGDFIGTVIWLFVIVWGASGLFAQLQSALNKIWEVKAVPGRSPLVFFKNRLFSFILVVLVGVALLLTLGFSTWLSAFLQDHPEEWLGLIVRPLQLVITLGMMTVLIAAMFKILPDVIIRWRDMWVGALFTAVLFSIGQFALSQYLSRSNVGSVFGAAGSLTAILVWIYYSAQILLFGAEFTEVWARNHGAYIRPDADAMWINEDVARRETDRANKDFVETDAEHHKLAWMEEQKKKRSQTMKRAVTVVKNVRPVRRHRRAADTEKASAEASTTPTDKTE